MDKTQLPLEHDDFFETSHRFSSMHITIGTEFFIRCTHVCKFDMCFTNRNEWINRSDYGNDVSLFLC